MPEGNEVYKEPENSNIEPNKPMGLAGIKSKDVQGNFFNRNFNRNYFYRYEIQDQQKKRFLAAEVYNKEFFAQTETEKNKNIETYSGMVAAWQEFYGAQAVYGSKQSYGLSTHASSGDDARFIRGSLTDDTMFEATTNDSGTTYSFKKTYLRSNSQRESGQLYQYAVEEGGQDKLRTITCSLGKLHQAVGMVAVAIGGGSRPPDIKTFEGHYLVKHEADNEYEYNNGVQSKLVPAKSFPSYLYTSMGFSAANASGLFSDDKKLQDQIAITEGLHRGNNTIYQLAKMSSVMDAHAAIDIISEAIDEVNKIQDTNDSLVGETDPLIILKGELNGKDGLSAFKEGDQWKPEFVEALKPLIERNKEKNILSGEFIKKGLMRIANISGVPRALAALRDKRKDPKNEKPPVFHYNGKDKIELDYQSLTGVHSDKPSEQELEVHKTLKKYNTGADSNVKNTSVVDGIFSSGSVFSRLNKWSIFKEDVLDTLEQREQAIEVNNALKAINEASEGYFKTHQEQIEELENNIKDEPDQASKKCKVLQDNLKGLKEKFEEFKENVEKLKENVCNKLCEKVDGVFKLFQSLTSNDVQPTGMNADDNEACENIFSKAKSKITTASETASEAQQSLDSYKPPEVSNEPKDQIIKAKFT
ncbi:MAG: hypothetical protein P8L77_05270 [Gammaproteobacteria bacterium]|nr:hypothetical protein [Gammaproteobacteria bacterium]